MKRIIAGLGFVLACSSFPQAGRPQGMGVLEKRFEELRERHRIVGIGAVIVKDQAIVWSKGFGLANVETRTPVTDSTVFHLASLTKPVAATVLLQLVDEGKVSLDDPVTKYGITLTADGPILVRHLLSHTSERVPGTRYSYSGNRFGALDRVIEQADGRSVAAAIQARIVAPLGLKWMAPNPGSPAFAESGKSRPPFLANLASGYQPDRTPPEPLAYPAYFGGAAGLVSTVRDYAAFSMALDRDLLLKPATRALAWTPTRDADGRDLPYGLGWFTTTYKGARVIWHYGYWTANSSLIVKLPERGYTLVIAANTDGLSSPYPLGSGRLETSDWARAFLDAFLGKTPPL